MQDDEMMRALAEAVAKQRGYAGFYDWPEKRQKELGLLEAFAEASGRIGRNLEDCRLQAEHEDPPDAWAKYAGDEVAIELTEFVDGSLVKREQREKQEQWRWWRQEDVASKLLALVQKKDHAGFGKNIQFWLVIHCDEPALSSDLFSKYLAELPQISVRGLNRCFVLLSYDPALQGAPLLEVSLQAA